jgi:formylglycine-generating enzyme required for sulfatase activity
MVTDDPKQAQKTGESTPAAPQRTARNHVERTPLGRLIAGSPQGLGVQRVLEWADQLAKAIDDLHARGGHHGSIDPTTVFIDEHDRAHLAVATRSGGQPSERDLLLGDAGSRQTRKPTPVRPRDDVRALAATLYEALGGDRLAQTGPTSLATPVPGASVQINLALLAVLSGAGAPRVTRAGDLVRMLRGGTVPTGGGRRGARTWINRAAVALMAAAAVVSVVAGIRLWIGPGPGRWQRDPHVASGDLLAADREIKEALAARAQAQRPTVIPPRPDAEPEPRRDARRAAERAADAWQRALALAPDPWLHDDAVQSGCSDALVVAEDAKAAARAGRYEQATRDYDLAAQLLAEATVLHEQGVTDAPAEAASARADGHVTGAMSLLDEVAFLAGLEEIDAEGIEAHLPKAGAPPGARTPSAVEQVIDGAPAPVGDERPATPAPRNDAVPVAPRPRTVRVNSLSQTLIPIEPGTFAMGSPHGEPLRDEGEWQHAVSITHAFSMARVEVTRGQFAAFVKETGYITDAERAGWSHGLGEGGRWRQMDRIHWRDPGFPQTDSHPVVCVSLHDALAFCRWLSDREGRTYRLPTEAEWEFACRAGSSTAYAWGDDVFHELPWANAADKAWTDRFPEAIGFRWRDECTFTSPVGRFPANPWGLFDMHGNVTEWCLDRYVPYGVEAVVDAVDPEAMSMGNPAPRVMRGGSFAATPAQCRAAHRDAGPPGSSFVTVGFRIVVEEGQP